MKKRNITLSFSNEENDLFEKMLKRYPGRIKSERIKNFIFERIKDQKNDLDEFSTMTQMHKIIQEIYHMNRFVMDQIAILYEDIICLLPDEEDKELMERKKVLRRNFEKKVIRNAGYFSSILYDSVDQCSTNDDN